ncbi:MAG: NAD-dependent epimerase/dehydratase family protein, partial [Actinomycetota bacterium]|nr:NAD-dependent epimerase/dehydratase family protein [Actinomycetota bacterium]
MKAFVTGASGFVGRHLVAHLRDCGDEVVPTDRSDGGPDLLDADGFATL